MAEDKDVVKTLIKALETSNKLLNTYYKETPPGEKRECIKNMIDVNTECIMHALEYEASVHSLEQFIKIVNTWQTN